ncbi:MAG: hypothetical protein J6D11_06415 [Clostridia bacterium]|nr:hypothetical protein [Clostridia bacterium]
MKNKILKGFSAFVCLLVVAALLLCSCTDADIVISHESGAKAQSTQVMQETEKFSLTVNISTGTFHLSENCRYAEKTKEENKKIILYSDVQTAIEDGYTPCSVCAGEYKN